MTATITRSELHGLIEAGDVIVVETLAAPYFEDAHLPGAINIPHTEVAALAPELLPDKHAAIVTYCSNPACANSGIAAAQLAKAG
jgi:rhodanese-related sulfurtransferase